MPRTRYQPFKSTQRAPSVPRFPDSLLLILSPFFFFFAPEEFGPLNSSPKSFWPPLLVPSQYWKNINASLAVPISLKYTPKAKQNSNKTTSLDTRTYYRYGIHKASQSAKFMGLTALAMRSITV